LSDGEETDEPSAVQTAIRIANDLSVGEIAGSPGGTQYPLILLLQAIERGGLPLTGTGNLSRAVVAEMCKLIEWPDYNQADAFRFNNVIMSQTSCRCMLFASSLKQQLWCAPNAASSSQRH
jgi:hypothetical protein